MERDAVTDGGWGPRSPAEAELRVDGFLTAPAVKPLCLALARHLAARPLQLWLDLADVKGSDAVGLAALLQATRLAERLGVPMNVLPSAALYRALLSAGILEELPLRGPRARSIAIEDGEVPTSTDAAAAGIVGEADALVLRTPAWSDLALFEQWAHDPLLDQMLGSELLYLARHRGPHHPEFTAKVLHDPTAVTVIVEPRDEGATPLGFLRLFHANLLEGFAFFESAVVDPRALRRGLGIRASRLFLSVAMDLLRLRRVETKVYAYNPLSINAVRRNGFVLEGRLRKARHYGDRCWDILVFSILDDEMRAQRTRDYPQYLGFWPPDARP